MSLTPQSLADAMENNPNVDYGALYPAVNQCLLECECTTVNRSAMWFGQVGEESGGLRWMEEIADGSEYEGRADLGNTQPGDGARFKGRGPIQVTGRHNYTALSQWAFNQGLVPSATFFVDSPSELSNTTYGFIGVTWYWTTQRPMNDAADARDIVLATRYVNGGTHGLDDRTQRWQHALGMGDSILPGSDTPPPVVIPRPDFSEDNQLGNDPNDGDRNGDVPSLWLIHTQEPKVAPHSVSAQNLADFLKSTAGTGNPVSYHYTIGQTADGRVEVIDVVDTDLESWSVLDANEYSINACFAGSSVNLSTQEWMDQFGNAIDVAAYLAVQDCIKYGIAIEVNPPPYHRGAGISDHKYVTQVLGMGSHVDVGNNFPWPYFAERVAYYAGAGNKNGGFLMALSDQQQQEMYDALCGQRESGSPYKKAGGDTHSNADYIGFTDSAAHALSVEFGAITLGDATNVAQVKDAAERGVERAVAAWAKVPDEFKAAKAKAPHKPKGK